MDLIDDPNVQTSGVSEEDNNDDPPNNIGIDQGDVDSDEDRSVCQPAEVGNEDEVPSLASKEDVSPSRSIRPLKRYNPETGGSYY